MSRRGRRRERAADDRGLVVVLMSVLMVALVIMVAIVVDMGFARSTKRSLKSDTDIAAVAAGYFLSGQGQANVVSNPAAACAAAVRSISMNVKDFPAGAAMSPACSSLPSDAASCSNAATPKATLTSTGSAPYVLKIEYPLPEGDIADSRLAAGTGVNDGTEQCRRMRVSLSRRNAAIFGGIAGSRGQTLAASTVVRSGTTGTSFVSPALLLLERSNCGALEASGQGGVRVLANAGQGGVIHTDTASGGTGSVSSNCHGGNACNTNNFAVVGTTLPAGAGGGPSIVAENASGGSDGKIAIYGLTPSVGGAGGCTAAGLSVAPTPGGIVSRKRVDDKYNDPANPFGLTISGLHTQGYGAVTQTAAAASAAGYTVIQGGACNAGNAVYQANRVFVNCGDFSATNVVFRGSEIVFSGTLSVAGGYVAFPNATKVYVRGTTSNNANASGVSVTANGQLSINTGERVTGKFDYVSQLNGGTAPASWGRVDCVMDRSGAGGATGSNMTTTNFTRFATFGGRFYINNGSGDFCQTTFYLGANASSQIRVASTTGGNCTTNLPCPTYTGAPNSRFELNSGSQPRMTWSAPNQNPDGPNTNSPFDGLALWTEAGASNASCSIGGQGAMVASGVYFFPNCQFTYTGQADSNNPLNAQFIGRTLNMSGQGVLVMKPNPKQTITIPTSGIIALIR